MSYICTEEDLELLKQKSKVIYCKIELLSKNSNGIFVPSSQIEGDVISGTFSSTIESSIRNTIPLKINVKDDSLIVGENSKIWFNKRIRVYVGYLNSKTNKIKWYNKGMFIFSQVGYNYNSSTKILSVNCNDLMSLLDGSLNGNLTELSYTIPSGQNIRQAMIDTLTTFTEIKDYIIDDIGSEIVRVDDFDPRTTYKELKFTNSDTVYTIISTLRDLYPYYQTYFNEEGTFICNRIPTHYKEGVYLTEDIINPLVTEENNDYDLSKVYNSIVLYGKAYETDYFSEKCTSNSSLYSLELKGITNLKNDSIIGFKSDTTNKGSCSIKIDLKDSSDLIIDTIQESLYDYNGSHFEPTYYAEVCNGIGSGYILSGIGGLSTIKENDTIGFIANVSNNKTPTAIELYEVVDYDGIPVRCLLLDFDGNNLQPLTIQKGKKYSIKYKLGNFRLIGEYQEDKELPPGAIVQNQMYVVKFVNNKFYLLGEYQINARAEDTNPLSPFNISKIGKKPLPLSGAEYESIYSTPLAKDRAKYELFKNCRLQETIQLEMIDIPFLCVNQKIKYTSKTTNQTNEYIVKSIDSEIGSGVMNISIVKFYPEFAM